MVKKISWNASSKRSGVNRSENVLSPANVANLDVDWSAATGNVIESSPAVANGVVYVGSFDHHLYTFNAQTGSQLAYQCDSGRKDMTYHRTSKILLHQEVLKGSS
jgi:hypothetical protein